MNRMPSLVTIRQHGFFLSLFVITAALRLIPLAHYQFTYDEISALQRVNFHSFAELIGGGVKIDAHPALLQVIIFYITKWIGPGTWYIKLPFLIASLAGLVYAYVFCLRNFSAQAARIAAVVFSLSLPYVYYAPIARMYGIGVFFCLALLFHFYEIVFNGNASFKHLCLFTLFLVTGALNHHMNALFCVTVYSGGWLFILKHARLRYLLTGCAAVLLYLPHLRVTLYQLDIGGIGVEQGGWLEPPTIKAFPEFLNVIFGTGSGLLVALIILLAAWRTGVTRYPAAKRWFPAVLFVLNFSVIFIYSVSRFPIYQHSVMLFSSTGLVIWFGSLADTKSRSFNHVITGTLLFWLGVQTYIKKDYFRQCIRSTYEYQFNKTAEYNHESPDIHGVFFDTDSVMASLFAGERTFPLSLSGSTEQQTLAGFVRFIDTLDAGRVALGSSMPIHQAIVRSKFPVLIENTQTQGVHYKVYSSRQADLRLLKQEDGSIASGSADNPDRFTYPANIELPLHVQGTNEFPFLVTASYHEVVRNEGNVVLAEARVRSKDFLSDVQCVVSVTSGKKIHHYSAGITADQQLQHGEFVLRASLFAGRFHDQTNDSTRLNIYIWNRSKQPFEILDLKVQTINHWPEKWQFWK